MATPIKKTPMKPMKKPVKKATSKMHKMPDGSIMLNSKMKKNNKY